MRTYTSCLVGAARQLDDHHSDASNVGAAILSACATEYGATVAAFDQGMTDEQRQTFEQSRDSAKLGEATLIVLQERAKVSKASN